MNPFHQQFSHRHADGHFVGVRCSVIYPFYYFNFLINHKQVQEITLSTYGFLFQILEPNDWFAQNLVWMVCRCRPPQTQFFNFLQSIIATWWMHKILKWMWYQYHIIKAPEIFASTYCKNMQLSWIHLLYTVAERVLGIH